ncbi:hypothetical protein O3M35_005594 [Rhynocoris fuscipes]|uniref:Odorant receptor n=1 Tax=Rhynocoris fuscipes TaxID=488301 RepID=A0AAW1DP50_9HEMI
MTAYISWGDIGEMGETLHYSAFIITTTSELTNGLLHRSQMEYMMRSLGYGVYDYGETLDEDTAAEIKKICSDAKRNKNFHSKIFTAMVLLALCFIILSKTVTKAFIGTNDDETNNKDEDFNGIIRYTPVPCWYPFDARDSAYMYYILQYAAGYAAALSVLATDVIYICLSEEIAAQLKIVGITLRNAVQRAKKFMVSTGEKNIKKSLSRCLSCSVEHHISLEIGDQIYESDWIKYSSEMKNFVLMVTGRSLKPKTLSAGGFSDLSMVTFSNVLSSAYSYFNLLNASQ